MIIDNNNTASPAPAPRPRVGVATGALLLAATALVLFRPWVERPFDVLDFSEFLPFLTAHDGAWGRFAAFLHYYVGAHARFNVVSYAGLVAKWTLLGASPVLWQWARVLEMGLVVAGVYWLFRRLALRPGPALAGAALFVVSRLSSEAWFRMTMGEPLGLLLALGALLLATTWHEHPTEMRRVVGAGILMALAILAKEMLVALVPVLWCVGIARGPDGRFGRPDFGAETRRLMAWSGLAPLAAFGGVIVAATTGGDGGFTDLYGHSPFTVGRAFDLFTRPWLIQGELGGIGAFLLPANALFLLFLLAGGWAAWRRPEQRRQLGAVLGIAVALSIAFAALYSPWPYTYHYYAIPFFLGPALLFATAVQALADSAAVDARVISGGVLLLCLLVAPETGEVTSVTIAMQQVNGDLAGMLGAVPRATRIVAARRVRPPQPWIGVAPTLRRYALATGAATSLPPAVDLPCPEAEALLHHPLGGTVFITDQVICGGLPRASLHLTRAYPVVRVSWAGASIAKDSIVVDVLVGHEAMQP